MKGQVTEESVERSDRPSEEKPSEAGLGIFRVASSKNSHVTIFVDIKGQIFGVGDRSNPLLPIINKFEPVQLQRSPNLIPMPVPGVKIEGVAVGSTHALAWDVDGNTYGWGLNKYGCLGIKENNLRSFEQVSSPELVHSILGAKIVSCFIVGFASFAVTYQGKCYYWGK